MSGESPQREQATFDAALELAPGQRGAFLDRATSGDAIVPQRVESLLRGYEASDFLEQTRSTDGSKKGRRWRPTYSRNGKGDPADVFGVVQASDEKN